MAEFKIESPVCRICMTEKSYFISILETREINEPAMYEMISECTRFKVELNDTLPKKICMVCADDVCTAYKFKKRAEESYKHLCNLYHKQASHMNFFEKCTQTEEHIYSCEHCQLKFYNPADLQSHRKIEHQGVERRCRFCNKSFELLRQLKSHLIQEHPDQYIATNLQCQICNRKFSRRDHLNRHMRNVHKMDPKSLSIIVRQDTTMENPFDSIEVVNEAECEEQDKLLTENLTMSDSETEMAKNLHNVLFDPIFCNNTEDQRDFRGRNLNLPFPESICINPEITDYCKQMEVLSKPFQTSVSLREDWNGGSNRNVNHASYFTDEEKCYDWKPKESLLKTPENIVIKVEIPNYDSENDDVKPECAVYDELNQYYENINDEIYKQELNDSGVVNDFDEKYAKRIRNTCGICQHVFSRQCHLRRHMQSTHSSIKPHACPYCEKRFTRTDHLKKHVINVHEIKAHKCDLCDKAFVKSEILMRHKEIWHDRKTTSNDRKIYECEFCQHKFTSKHYLTRHRLMHTDRTFACRFCESTFKERQLFREHEREHKRIAAIKTQSNLMS